MLSFLSWSIQLFVKVQVGLNSGVAQPETAPLSVLPLEKA